MCLRSAAAIALLLFGLSLALPALPAPLSDEPMSGWEAALFSAQVSVVELSTPSNFKGALAGGAAREHAAAVSLYVSGTNANLLLLLAAGCAIRRRPIGTLVGAAAALLSAGICFLALLSDRKFEPFIGIWLWIGSMLWLSMFAAWKVWRIESVGGRIAASISEERIPA